MITSLKNKIRPFYRKCKMFFLIKFYSLKNVHKTIYISGKSTISKDLKAGPYVFIAGGCVIYPKVTIGDYTLLAPNVKILGGDHEINKVGLPIIFSGRSVLEETNIGKDVWIGCKATILRGVTIGEHSVIAAHSVVNKDVPSGVIVAGAPARVVKNIVRKYE